MNKREALAWIREHHDANEDVAIDDDDLDAALRALGYDPDFLRGDDEDPIDRRWDTACAEVQSVDRVGPRPPREGGFPGHDDDA